MRFANRCILFLFTFHTASELFVKLGSKMPFYKKEIAQLIKGDSREV